MAILKNSTIQNLTIAEQATVNGKITSTPESASVQYRSNTSYSTSGPIPFTHFFIDNKINRSNNNSRYTILEPGLYFVTWHNISQNANSATTRTYIRVNGSRWSQARGEGTPAYPMVNAFVLVFMNEGDFFDMDHGAGSIYLTGIDYNDFTIFKVT